MGELYNAKMAELERERGPRRDKVDDLDLTGVWEKYYTPPEIAERFSVAIPTVHLWIKKGLLEARKIGGRWRVREEDVSRFVAERSECYY